MAGPGTACVVCGGSCQPAARALHPIYPDPFAPPQEAPMGSIPAPGRLWRDGRLAYGPGMPVPVEDARSGSLYTDDGQPWTVDPPTPKETKPPEDAPKPGRKRARKPSEDRARKAGEDR